MAEKALVGRNQVKSTLPKLQMSENTERDIWESAGILIERHGEMATIEASRMADCYCEAGDQDMRRAWLRVMRALADMMDVENKVQN